MSIVKVLNWPEPNVCIYGSDEFFEAKQLEDAQMHLPDSAGRARKVVKVEKADDLASQDWPHVYRMTVQPVDEGMKWCPKCEMGVGIPGSTHCPTCGSELTHVPPHTSPLPTN